MAQLGPNLDFLCARQLVTVPFCENYAKHYIGDKVLYAAQIF